LAGTGRGRGHRRHRLSGRDPGEAHRAATPLELLYDLTFVVAFGAAADDLALYMAERHFGPAVGGFCLAVFAVTWAWMNYSWFASAYDNDDWGVPGRHNGADGRRDRPDARDRGVVRVRRSRAALNVGVMVFGYVVMRLSMVIRWSLVARHDPARVLAARGQADASHRERCGVNGPAVLGVPVRRSPRGILSVSGGCTSWCLWGVLERQRERAHIWGAGQILLFGFIAATGAGLHVAACFLEGAAVLDTAATEVPIAILVLALYVVGLVFLRQRDHFICCWPGPRACWCSPSSAELGMSVCRGVWWC
jgi:hypothetical protein